MFSVAVVCAVLLLGSTSQGEELQSAPINLWAPLENKVIEEMARLDKSTVEHDCHATCAFSVHTDLSDYDTAKAKCEAKSFVGFPAHGGMKLASIHSELENRIATLMLQYAYGGDQLEGTRYEGPSNWAWIGLEKVNHTESRPDSGKLVWEEDDWEWVDGSRLDDISYTNWMDKNDVQIQPDMWKGEEGDEGFQLAARIFRKTRAKKAESGVWDDTFKNTLHPYICKFNVPVHYIVYPELLNWYEAKQSCESKGFYFAKIRNKAENEKFVAAAQLAFKEDRHDPKFNHENWIWIGATDLNEWNEFRFYDGEEIDFTIPWARNQHDNKTTKEQGSQDHVAVSRWGTWDDSFGNDWKRPYACQCNPNGMEVDEEMQRINAEWENEEERKKQIKERNKAEKERKKEERKRRKEEKKANKAEKAAENERKKAEKAAKKAEWEQKKAEKAAEKEAEKERKKAEREAKKADNEKKKAEKAAEKAAEKEKKKAENEKKKADKAAEKAAEKERKKAEREAKKAEKAASKDAKKAANKAAKKAEKAAEKERKKAEKAAAKAAKKAAKKSKKGGEQLEKRDEEGKPWDNPIRGGLEKRDEQWGGKWATIRGLEKREAPEYMRGLEKREVPEHMRGLEKREVPEYMRGLEKREEWNRGLKKREEQWGGRWSSKHRRHRHGLEKREEWNRGLKKREEQWGGRWSSKHRRHRHGLEKRENRGARSVDQEEEEQWSRGLEKRENRQRPPFGAELEKRSVEDEEQWSRGASEEIGRMDPPPVPGK